MEDEKVISLPSDLAAELGTPELTVYYEELSGGAKINGARLPNGAEVKLAADQRAAIERILVEQCKVGRVEDTYGDARHAMHRTTRGAARVEHCRTKPVRYRPGRHA